MKRKTKYLVTAYFILSSCILFAQADSSMYTPKKGRAFIPTVKLGYNKIKFSTVEAGILFGRGVSSKDKQTTEGTVILSGPSIELEAGKFRQANILLAPKISYEWNTSLLGWRISCIDYIEEPGSNNFYVAAELGITGVLLNLYGGLHYSLSGERVAGISDIRFSVCLNIPTKLFGK